MLSPGIIIAFVAGILSVASPCILPVIPSFIGYVTGVSLSRGYRKLKKKEAIRKLLVNTLFFGAGFSIIFLLFGAVIGAVGEMLVLNRPVFQTIGGIIIMLFGLQLTGLINIPSLMKEKKIHPDETKPVLKKMGYLRSFLMGIFFAFGWAPCYGPIVGAIFTLAATRANFGQAMLLFFFYSLGFLIPLIFFTILIGLASEKLKKIQTIAKYSSIAAGIFVMILGFLLMTNNLSILVNWINMFYNGNNISLL